MGTHWRVRRSPARVALRANERRAAPAADAGRGAVRIAAGRGAALALAAAAALAGPGAGAASASTPDVRVRDLTTDRAVRWLGTDPASAPRFGWRLAAPGRGVEQGSYRILVATDPALLRPGAADVWDSGTVASGDSADVRYDGPALSSRTRYWWTVRVTTTRGADSGWSRPTWWETALRDGEKGSVWGGIEQTAATGADQLGSGSVGQSFSAEGRFERVGGMFVEFAPSGFPSTVTLTLHEGGPGGPVLASRTFANVKSSEWLDLTPAPGTTFPAGDHYLVAHDLRTSGAGMLGWWSHVDDRYAGGTGYLDGAPAPGDRVFRVVPAKECATGDWSAEWITLPSQWATPIAQGQATGAEQLTGRSLGQTFSADQPFATAEAKFVEFAASGNPSSLTLSLYAGGPGGRLLARRRFEHVVRDRWLAVEPAPGTTFPAGDYYLEASDLTTSGDGMLGWWGHVEDRYPGGTTWTDGVEGSGDRVFRVTIPEEAPPLLRKRIELAGAVVRARAYVSALGLYELHVNGRRIGRDLLAPGWTDYAKRVKYQVFDLTSALRPGANALGAMLADGWYSGTVGGAGRYLYGSRPAFLLQLEVEYADGRTARFVTDESWRGTREGPVLSADVYHGERYDARRELAGWSGSGYDDGAWSGAVSAGGAGTCAARDPQTHESTTAISTVPARSVRQLGPGRWLFDLGREIAGVARLRVSGPAGQELTIRHAPRLRPDGELDTLMYRGAQATDRYTLRGGGPETWQPRFTYHGFRYVEVSGLRARPPKSAVTGVTINADVEQIGDFASGNRLVDELQRVLRWTQLSHWISIPIDTPERDERLGWVGEVSVAGGGNLFNYDAGRFVGSWLDELNLSQRASGAVPHVVPFVPLVGDGGAYATDAIVHGPWLLWQRYGDTRPLERGYGAMVRWMAQIRSTALPDMTIPTASYADHLNLDEPTPGGLIETASFARAARELAEIAAALGRDDDASTYAALATAVRAGFQGAYVKPDGGVEGDSQAGYAIALAYDLVPAELRTAAGARLARKIADRGGHLVTGYSGTPHVLQALTESGQHAVAESLILRRAYPSWGYMLDRGATTFWERWNSDTFEIDPNSGGNAGMNSFNHLPLATFGDWLYRSVGGLRNDGPGYRALTIAPQPGALLRGARTALRTPYGQARVRWKMRGDGRFALTATVPANTAATVRVPLRGGRAAFESGDPVATAEGVELVETSAEEAVVRVGSGTYRFTTR